MPMHQENKLSSFRVTGCDLNDTNDASNRLEAAFPDCNVKVRPKSVEVYGAIPLPESVIREALQRCAISFQKLLPLAS